MAERLALRLHLLVQVVGVALLALVLAVPARTLLAGDLDVAGAVRVCLGLGLGHGATGPLVLVCVAVAAALGRGVAEFGRTLAAERRVARTRGDDRTVRGTPVRVLQSNACHAVAAGLAVSGRDVRALARALLAFDRLAPAGAGIDPARVDGLVAAGHGGRPTACSPLASLSTGLVAMALCAGSAWAAVTFGGASLHL